MSNEMGRLSIYAKASLDKGEILEKVHCGCDAIELNLEDDFLRYGDAFLEYYGKELFTMKDIQAVHVPFNQDQEMLNLEWIFGHKNISVLENVFALAQYCGKIWNHRVMVVVHSCMAMYDFMQLELLQESIIDGLKILFSRYDQVDLAIENAVLLEVGKGDKFVLRLCNGIYQDTSELVKWLREYFGSRVGSVLDTCHAMMTEKYLRVLLEAADINCIFSDSVVEDVNIEHFFQMNQEICNLIHFNSLQGNGYRENHGIPFETLDEVEALLTLYEKYQFNCPLTLEVREDNYLDCRNYRKTKSLIEEACKRRAQ